MHVARKNMLMRILLSETITPRAAVHKKNAAGVEGFGLHHQTLDALGRRKAI